MVASLQEKTGRSLEEWQVLIAERGLQKHGDIMTFLKGEHGVSHGFANQIALRARPGPAEEGDPVEAMFAKRPEARAIYDKLLAAIQEFGSDVDRSPKKGYVSVRRRKQFAILQPAAGRLDVGINLKDTPPNGRLESSGSFNAMLTHRVRVASPAEVEDELLGWLRLAYEQA